MSLNLHKYHQWKQSQTKSEQQLDALLQEHLGGVSDPRYCEVRELLVSIEDAHAYIDYLCEQDVEVMAAFAQDVLQAAGATEEITAQVLDMVFLAYQPTPNPSCTN